MEYAQVANAGQIIRTHNVKAITASLVRPISKVSSFLILSSNIFLTSYSNNGITQKREIVNFEKATLLPLVKAFRNREVEFEVSSFNS